MKEFRQMSDGRPLALSVEKVRHEMMRGILVPRELVNEALKTTAAKLRARETKFFSHKGSVVETREVEDHGTQLAAADQIFSLAGLYARERETQASTPGVALEVDPRTGVVRIVVGSIGEPTAPALEEPRLIELPPASEASPAEASVVYENGDLALAQAAQRRVTVPDSAWRYLAEETVDG